MAVSRAAQPSCPPDVDVAAAISLVESLDVGQHRLARLVREAEALEQRSLLLARREREVARQQTLLVGERLDLAERASALEQREATLFDGQMALAETREELLRLEQTTTAGLSLLQEQADRLDERQRRYLSRWGWLIRSWRRRPKLGRDAFRVCDLLFVPTLNGYKLLEQTGIALAPGARLRVLTDERRSFVVSKIVPWPFEGRWCAYLQEEPLIQKGTP